MAENKEKMESIDFDEIDSKEKKTNIFDDFNTDASLQEDVRNLKKENEKDIFSYIHVIGKILQVAFFILFFVVLFLYAYIHVQKNDMIESQSYLDPICWFIAWEVALPSGTCSSIMYLEKYYGWELQKLKEEQSEEILEILPDIYKKENFLESKEVRFLLDKTENRLKVLEVLSKFDTLKNSFLWIDRKKLVCRDFEITADTNLLKTTCTAYMQGYSRVVGFSWNTNTKNISGTSISLANSFLNYIEKNSQDFKVVDRQKIFSVEDIESEDGYTNATEFDLTLQINF